VIRIRKVAPPPAPLREQGRRRTNKLRKDYDTGKRAFTFDGKVYGHAAVKERLIAEQHSKCCFCESKIGADGDVEHYRPKAGWRQAAGDPLVTPGYYWLAYDWDNLFLCCPACNQRFKGNLFPLLDPAARATMHADDIAREEPLFLHPAERDPEEYIGFRAEVPYPIDDNPHGQATIDALGLAREILNERRRDRLKKLLTFRRVVALADAGQLPDTEEAHEVVAEARQHLADAALR
jgi:uncharacterized protein (TIGR02646 family)